MPNATSIVREAGAGDRRWFAGGGTHTWKVHTEDTEGSLLMFEDELTVGKMTPLHRHPDVDETVYVLDGEIMLNLDGQEHQLDAGSMSFCPRGVPHAFLVRSETARLLFVQTPGSAQRFYLDASQPVAGPGPGPMDLDRVRDVAAQHLGTDLLGPPPFRP